MEIISNTNEFQLIGKTLMSYCGSESIVAIPDGVVNISNNAFEGNKIIEEVILPTTLESIGEKAFFKCKKLKKVTFPEGLKKIGNSAFKECGLESIEIPQSVTIVDKRAFQTCKKLKKIEIAPPQEQLVIGGFAFHGTAIEEITFPVGVVEIGTYALSSCVKLKEIQILDKSVKLGDALIYLDGRLEGIYMPNGIKSLKSKSLSTDIVFGGGGYCCASKILAPLSVFKTLRQHMFERYHIVSIAAVTYMENITLFSAKEQKAWDAYIAENAAEIREKFEGELSPVAIQYLDKKGI